jgi:hypothetical protein
MSSSAERIFGGIKNSDAKNIDNLEEFETFKPFKSFQPPPLFLPRVAGEDEGGGLNGAQRLNGLNVLNS